MEKKPDLHVLLAGPRGFCAGVDRAIKIVERALEKYGSPVYVRHQIVHNKYVVESLEAKGAIFVKELDEVPNEDVPVIFSAHGVPKSVPAEAERRNMLYFDATCPLVSKVHRGAERFYNLGYTQIMIGHAGHPEVAGTMGQLPDGAVVLVEDPEDVSALKFPEDTKLAYITQTTLSLDDTKAVVEALRQKFPEIVGPKSQDICYATTNRQLAVKNMATQCDAMMVVGAPNSSNSMRLTEVAVRAGCPKSMLVQRARDIDWSWMDGVTTLGITAGASAPEELVAEILEACRARFAVTTEEVEFRTENVTFRLPPALQVEEEAVASVSAPTKEEAA